MYPTPHSSSSTEPHGTDHQLVPGKLRGDAVLTLQTQQAARLVRGRAQTAEKPPILGLLGFAALCRTIWHGTRADDPYADWWQQRVDSALTDARLAIDTETARLDDLFATDDGLAVTPAQSDKPVCIALNFTNPDAFRAAQLIGRYDQLACRALALGHTGGLARKDVVRLLNAGGRAVRRTLQSAVGYRFLGIDRASVRQQSARAEQARQLMGECPESVIHGPQYRAARSDSLSGDAEMAAAPAVFTATPDSADEAPRSAAADCSEVSAALQDTESHGAR
ncbi:MAG: TIGR03761 family integrating conjugative element protein [Chromatocurvus sp.]